MFDDHRVLVSAATADDAGVFCLDRNRALVQTVDFFTPIVDDALLYGKIAATNALSDVYAMGGRPLTAMNIMAMPTDQVPPEVIARILRGGALKVKEARCALIGGHTIRNPEPIYGLSVTGLVSPRKMIANSAARPGDILVLTKPLGTGILTTGIKRGLTSQPAARKAVVSMCRLNDVGADLAEKGWVRAGTDVTGFGLLGHLWSLCRVSGVAAEIQASALPVLHPEVRTLIEQDCVPGGSRDNLKSAESWTSWQGVSPSLKILATDAQTSGGLLLCVAPSRLRAVTLLLKQQKAICCAVIGRIVSSSKAVIRVTG